MNKIFVWLTALICLVMISCNTSQKANTTAKTEEKETEEPSSPKKEAFTMKVLNDSIASPRMEMSGKVGDAMVTVNFGSPRVKERTIWGELVKYDKTWRTGANEATTFETSADLKVGGGDGTLPAGKYALFTVPAEQGAWKVVFNTQAKQWGAYNKDDSKDVLTVEATPAMTENMAEGLTFELKDGSLVMMWEKLSLPIALAAN